MTSDDGAPARPYTYPRPGLYADVALNTKTSGVVAIHGDDAHDKVSIAPVDTLYIEDDSGRRYRIDVGDKPSLHRIEVGVTRVL